MADTASTALKNSINDPTCVEKHIQSWDRIFKGSNSSQLEINISKDAETLSKITNKILPDSNTILDKFFNYFTGII